MSFKFHWFLFVEFEYLVFFIAVVEILFWICMMYMCVHVSFLIGLSKLVLIFHRWLNLNLSFIVLLIFADCPLSHFLTMNNMYIYYFSVVSETSIY